MKRIAAMVLAVVLALSVTLSASAVTYKVGSKGSAVLRIQQTLNSLGYGDLKEDGKYGSATAAAVKRFQTAKGLGVDGKVGVITLKALGISGNNNPEASTDSDGNDNSKIQYGSTGTQVREVQSLLKALNYPVTVDGKFGAATRKAVRLFQSLNNLTVDGIVGAKTLAKLQSGTAAAYNTTVKESTYSTLKKGSYDTTANKNAVTRLQKALRAKGYTSVSVTGYFDAATYTAVVAFQKANGLKVDGVAGSATQAALYSSSSSSSSDEDDDSDDDSDYA